MVIRPPATSDLGGIVALLRELGYPAQAPAVEPRLDRLTRQGNVVVPVDLLHADNALAILSALIVAEGHRGHGIGRRLVDAVEIWAIRRGAGRITVASGLARVVAHAFYERLGYEHTGRRYAKVLGQPARVSNRDDGPPRHPGGGRPS